MEYEEFLNAFDKIISNDIFVRIYIDTLSYISADKFRNTQDNHIYLFYKGLLIGLIDINIVKKLR